MKAKHPKKTKCPRCGKNNMGLQQPFVCSACAFTDNDKCIWDNKIRGYRAYRKGEKEELRLGNIEYRIKQLEEQSHKHFWQ